MHLSTHCSSAKKIIVFFFAIFCGTSYVLGLRYSRGVLNETYNPQNLVFVSECCKLFICIILTSFGIVDSSMSETNYSQINKIIYLLGASGIAWIPAICYFVQNILDYKACEYLPACVYSTLLQLKILSKALLSMLILNKTLNYQHWRALFMLLMGSCLMEYHTYNLHINQSISNSNDPIRGGLFVLIIIMLSGLAGCVTELLLKNQQFNMKTQSNESTGLANQTQLTLWDRNTQISFYSVLCGLININVTLITGTANINEFFDGFSYVSMVLIALLTCIGLSFSIIIKYTDVIMSSFMGVISMVFIAFGSHLFFHDSLDFVFIIGVMVIMFATFDYNKACQHIITNANGKQKPLQIELKEVDPDVPLIPQRNV